MNSEISRLEISKVLRVNDLLWRCLFYDELITTPYYSLCFSSSYDLKFMNCALNFNLVENNIIADDLEYIEKFFAQRKRSSNIFLTNFDLENQNLMSLLEEYGYKLDNDEETTVRGLEISNFIEQPITDGLDIVEVRTEDQLANYLMCSISGYSTFDYTPLASSISKLYFMHLDGITQLHFVGYMDNKPVASASVGVCCGIAVLVNASVVPEYRKRGINISMMQKRIIEAEKIGANRFYYITEPDNIGSIKSGNKLGFTEVFRQIMYSK